MASEKKVLLYLVRHGSTALNHTNLFRGPFDPELDAQGLRDAEELADYFENCTIHPLIITSDRKRSVKTAETIAKRLRQSHFRANDHREELIRVLPLHQLRPLNVGTLGGQEKTEANMKDVQYHVDNPEVSFISGESLKDFRARVRPVLSEAVEKSTDDGAPVIILCSSTIIHDAGEMCNHDHTSGLVEPGGIAMICAKDGKVYVETLLKPDKTNHTPYVS